MSAAESLTIVQPPSQKPNGLVVKLCDIMAEIGRVAKTGHNEHFNYSYARESDILQAVRMGLANRHVLMVPRIVKTDFRQVQGTKSTMTLCHLEVNFDFTDGDSGEILSVFMIGQATDSGTGEKAFFKAFSGATKYCLMKTFLISTRREDEPEDSVVESVQPNPEPPAPPSPWERIKAAGVRYQVAEKDLAATVKVATGKPSTKALEEADCAKVEHALALESIARATDEASLRAAKATIKPGATLLSEEIRAELDQKFSERLLEVTAKKEKN